MNNFSSVKDRQRLELRPSLRVTQLSDDEFFLTNDFGLRKRLTGSSLKDVMDILLDDTLDLKEQNKLFRESGSNAEASLQALRDAGLVREVTYSSDKREQRTFWDILYPGGDVRKLRIGLAAVDESLADQVINDIGTMGDDVEVLPLSLVNIDVDKLSSCDAVVVTYQDYTQSVLDSHMKLTAASIPVLYVRQLQSSWWIGPVVNGPESSCIGCLAFYQKHRSITDTYIQQHGGTEGNRRAWNAQIRPLRLAAAGTIVANIARIIAGLPNVERRVDVLDLTHGSMETHRLEKRPQCSVCGNPRLQAQLNSAPIQLKMDLESKADDGGHRSIGPEEFLQKYEHLVSKVSGPISYLVDMSRPEDELFTFSAGQNFAMAMPKFADLKFGLRSMSSGKGRTRIQAKASALGEAIERYSGLHHQDEERLVSSFNDLDPRERIHPNDIHLFSERQFEEREYWNAKPSSFHWVGQKLDESQPIEWSPAWTIKTGERRLLPTAMSYYNYVSHQYSFHPGANSNGCAAGTSYVDATVQGLYELIERDSTALWWYSRCSRPQVNLESFNDPFFLRWREMYRKHNRDVWILDLTSDLGIPVFASISARNDKPVQDILIGLGCNADPAIAISRAITEMNQFFPAVIDVDKKGNGYRYDDPTQMDWWKNALLKDHPYLLPEGEKYFKDYLHAPSQSLGEELNYTVNKLENRDIEVSVMNQTRLDIGVPVVRVIAPGLRHFWPRYAPGRLFDIPLELGWVDHQLSEEELNDVPLFI